ncbi:hypothetical protein WMY93_016042 [Mugilogobius chulae]|uniref:Dynein heavy chain 1, axonemal n=1 Tax=Mugilogobius chulae TaxID=88201 RepID=A0AAW0NSC4_9GOBI
MASGPCGSQFKEAFSCFHYSKEEVKGSECIDHFRNMQECMQKYPELYPQEDEEDTSPQAEMDMDIGPGSPGRSTEPTSSCYHQLFRYPVFEQSGVYADIHPIDLQNKSQPVNTLTDGVSSKSESKKSNDKSKSQQAKTSYFCSDGDLPKVQLPYQTVAGKIPRKLAIERCRREYSLINFEDLLAENGIDSTCLINSNDFSESSYLPLEIFDNVEFDCRTPEDWLSLGITEGSGNRKPVPAKALLPTEVKISSDSGKFTQEYNWHLTGVLDYNKETSLYLVEKIFLKDSVGESIDSSLMEQQKKTLLSGEKPYITGGRYWVPRIRLLFKAEDPRIFLQRVKNALHLRDKTETLIRNNLYVNGMPIRKETSSLDSSCLQRIRKYVRTTPGLRLKILVDCAKRLEEDIQLDYISTMNHMAFDKIVTSQPELFSEILIPKKENPLVRKRESVPAPAFPYKKTSAKIALCSVLTQPKVLIILSKIWCECDNVANMQLFNTLVIKPLRLEDFEAMQSKAHTQLNLYLSETWISTMTKAIRPPLLELGKGTYNVNQSSWEIYRISKLRKLMNVVRFKMQDALRYLVQNSLANLAQRIIDACHTTLTCSEDLIWGNDLITSIYKPKKNTLFLVDLVLDQTGVHYSTPLDHFPSSLVKLFDEGILTTDNVPQVEKFVMENLFFGGKVLLESVNLWEPEVIELRKKIHAALSQAAIPLRAYAAEYVKYLDCIIKTLRHYSKAVRHTLCNKRKQLTMLLQDKLAQRLRNQIDNACEECITINRKLCEKPNTVEELFEMRKWIKQIPEQLRVYEEQLEKILSEYDVLEDYFYRLTDDDFKKKWAAVGWPQKIFKQIEKTTVQHKEDEEQFHAIQQSEQNNFEKQIDSLQMLVAGFAGFTDMNNAHEFANEMKRTRKELKECQVMAQTYNNRERLFGLPLTNYDRLHNLVAEFQPYEDLWITTSNWLRWHDSWLNDPLSSIDSEQLESNVTETNKVMHKCVKRFKDKPGCTMIATFIQSKVEEFRPYIPLIQGLSNLRSRHWEMLSERIHMKVQFQANLTFSHCLEIGLQNYADEIEQMAEVAGKEYTIEQALEKMKNEWSNLIFDVMPYKNTKIYILKSPDEASQLLDDHIVMTQSMAFSPFKKFFENRISKWESQLKITQDVLEEWLTCQRSLLYLEPIFSSPDINQQLPAEARQYQQMEKMWTTVMKKAYSNPKIIELCPDPHLLSTLKNFNSLIQQVQKGLIEYLEMKRRSFPRFYFLSDDELLEILTQTKDPTAVQPHLRKCFENIARLKFQPDLQITDMYSGEGEEVKLFQFVQPSGDVEDWLRKVEKSMKATIRDNIDRSLKVYYEQPREKWVLSWPGQVVIAGCQVFWTTEVSEAIMNGDLVNCLYPQLQTQLGNLVQLVRGDLSRMQRTVLSSLIVIEVHAKDVAAELVQQRVSSINDFEWISQLRYYWARDDLYIRVVNAEFLYGYEYLGNSGRLVITPLTDRCYLTLTGALHLKFGGAPAGPAGTGKTETTKDLGKALAIQTVVFNCSDQLDFKAMGKFFKGLASSGAWACFDEFNRIDVEVLSVVAQQITTIQKAQQQRVERFEFEGTEITLVPSCAVFITMNPGYAGRTELPDNLKALFRPVAMMVPNYAMIAEISLYSFGFSDAKVLSKKITTTFKLSSEQLSSQDHYDFGMRAVKTVISAAGNLKREHPEMNEELICLRAINDVNVPKFLQDDLKLFNGIVSDLFPKTKQEPINYGTLEQSMRNVCAEKNLKDVDAFIHKCIQLYETTVVRHGLMLVGPSGSGKTRCYEILGAAITALKGQPSVSGGEYEAVQTYVLNPKSITMGQLYGEYDLLTQEWTDGILPALVRGGASSMDKEKKWYMFDGPVDAVWIENMNTVLDDNKKLCLSSGEIIMLTDDSIGFVRGHVKEVITSLDSNLTCSLLKLMDCFFDPFNPKENRRPPPESKVERLKEVIEPWFFFSLVWSVGATGDATSYQHFSNWLRNKMAKEKIELCFPADGLVYDYKLNDGGITNFEDDDDDDPNTSKVQWVSWMKDAPNVVITAETKYADIIVPTPDTVRMTFLLDMLLNNKKPVLCIGPTGTGKTLTMSDKLLKNMSADFITHFLMFSARTSANQTQDYIDSKLDKRRKNVFGPPKGKYFIFFIDDLNMPMLETYGAQPPIELLRQWMDHGGWFDRKQIGTFRHLIDINFACAMGPPGGGRNPITPRFSRHFNFLSFAEMDDASKKHIFTTVLGSWMVPAIQPLNEALVKATIQVYSTITSQLLPTPTKSHYTFNLRDLSKVFQGILMADANTIEGKSQLLQLWYHESCRVFQDRLVCAEDREWFSSLLKNFLTCQPILFGDFMIPGADHKVYTLINDKDMLVKVIEEYMDDYNQISKTKMKLVLFMDAIEHVCHICRILRQPLGNALLLGVGGSGRQSLTKLASYMLDYECFQIELSKNYGLSEWKEDLKRIMLKAGLQNQSITFLFVDTQIKMESFLEDINSILNSGDVPNLYASDEEERILIAMKPVVLEQGQQPTKANLMAAYIKKVRSNIHTVLCMSPMGEVYRARLRQFPSLVNCCTIDWFSAWPEEALQAVALTFLNEMPELEASSEALRGLALMCVKIHQMVATKCDQFRAELSRHNYVTPKSYLELLNIFSKLTSRKKNELSNARERMKTGLDKLLSTADDVKKMQEELVKMRPFLEEASRETEVTMETIQKDTIIAEETRKSVQEDEAKATEKAQIAEAIATDAQRDLDEALPALDAALTSLKSLNKNDVTEVRALQRPPPGVKLVIEAVCIMKGIKPKKVAGEKPGTKVNDYWEPGKGLLKDPGKFLEGLFNYDKDNIPDTVIEEIQPYMDDENFQPAAIAKVSKACTSICQWARAMYVYHFVARAVEPKRQALQEARDDLAITQKMLDDSKAKLAAVESGIAALQTKYDDCVARKNDLEYQYDLCEKRRVRADKLTGGLADEKVRWKETVQNLDYMVNNVTGDVLLSAGYVAYLGPFTGEYRAAMAEEWLHCFKQLNVPHTREPNLINTLGDPVKIRSWQIAGLPKDNLSAENGVIAQNSLRWALFIDPQGQANKWIKNMERENGLEVVKLSDNDFLRSLENAIRFGKPALLENVREELDTALEPVLLQQTFKQSGSTVLKLGDSVIPYHENFRMYITTKLPNPHYSPEISSKVTLINFTLSPSGLQDQLLGQVVAEECADLEEAKNQLIISNAQMKQDLKAIEDEILLRLSSTEGNPVDNEELIEALAASKVKAGEIQAKVTAAEKTEREIDATRLEYVPVAVRTQVLFFCVSDLSGVDPMYQYSLEWFLGVFVLFEKHKLMFAFLLCARILMNRKEIDMIEWRFLLSGGMPTKELQNPAVSWLSERTWKDILGLSNLENFNSLADSFPQHLQGFKMIFDSNQPHREPLPGEWDINLDSFQKLLVLRCLRADCLVQGLQDFVAAKLGQKFIEPQTSDLHEVFKESSHTTPLIFVLSPGTDPAADLYKFADAMQFSTKMSAISLGQGQGPWAETMMHAAMKKGHWVFFQNCHLAPSWMPALERLIEHIDPTKVHKDFRLWLTSLPSNKFPVSILQNGSKMTIEPPRGIKANLQRTYLKLTNDFINSSTKINLFKPLLLSLSLFHGIALERRKFGALGFNIPYEFTDGDLNICISQLRMFLDEYQNVPYKVLKYTAGEINYGGRVTDDWDRRCLLSILEDFYCPAVLEADHIYCPSGVYRQIDTSLDVKGYLAYISGLPINDTPEILVSMTTLISALLKMKPLLSWGQLFSSSLELHLRAAKLLKRL